MRWRPQREGFSRAEERQEFAMLKGALHIHSTYSDGDFSLAELREEFVAAGCRFACISDHADWFDQQKLDAYVRECADRSDDRFQFIPGLEYRCADGMHV